MKIEDIRAGMRVSCVAYGGKIYGTVFGTLDVPSCYVKVKWDRDFEPTVVGVSLIEPCEEQAVIVKEDVGSAATTSDGGSSDYYKIVVQTSHGPANVEVNDLIYALVGGDFDLGNVIKASRRMYLASKGGGKAGTDIAYDANKVKWFIDDFQMRFGK
jgi:hypothetical protein